MRIDRTHASWAVVSLAIFGISLVIYGMFRVPAATGSMGGTAAGLLFGSAGFVFMIFAALLGARKRVPVYRLGRAQTWMRGHLWLGLLSLPLILFTFFFCCPRHVSRCMCSFKHMSLPDWRISTLHLILLNNRNSPLSS